MSKHEITEMLAEAVGIDIDEIRGTYFTEGSPIFSDEITVRVGDEPTEIVVGYLAHDDMPHDFWENDEGAGKFREFTDQESRDAFIAEAEAEGKVAFVVDRYSHGASHYSIANTRGYPDRRWDVAPCAVFIPCDWVQDELKAGRKTREAVIEDSNAILDSYSSWCNGDVYGTVVETYEYEPVSRTFKLSTEDSCWGHIGKKWADEALEELLPPAPEGPEAEVSSDPAPGPGF